MVELLEQVNHWHWLAFGLALLALELIGTAGYFLWIGISAMLVGALWVHYRLVGRCNGYHSPASH